MTEPSTAPTDAADTWLVEAARYALLRRLAFALRHELVVNLQPISMMAEVLDQRLKQPTPDLAQLQASMGKISHFSRAAVQSCLDVVSWLAPAPHAQVALDAGVAECVSLLRSNFSFRGVSLRNDVSGAPMLVAQAGLRNVLPACLLAYGDAAQQARELVISVHGGGTGGCELRITEQAAQSSGHAFTGDPPYRTLQWEEVAAMARADGIALSHDGAVTRLSVPVLQSAAAKKTAR